MDAEALRRMARSGLIALLVTVPAWAYYLFEYNNLNDSEFGYSRSRVFAVSTAVLTTVVSLMPVVAMFVRQRSERPVTWSPGQTALIAAVGSGSVVSVMLNGGPSVQGLETIFAVAIAATAGAAIMAFTQVATATSPAGEMERRSAEAIVRVGKVKAETGTEAPSLDERRAAQASIGRQDIAAGFRQYGDANEASARLFLLTGVGIFAGSVGAALWLVTRLESQATVASILTRAAISVPGAVVFAVFVGEAAARRRYAAWGGLIAIQAEHLGPFTADMSDEVRNQLELQFARAVFRGGDVALEQSGTGTHLRRKAEVSTSAIPLPYDLVTQLLQFAASVATGVHSIDTATRGSPSRRSEGV